ncbi:MAG: iron-only hydrogenase system regulator [Lachnospiraceae bacterium]|nr:iron-only hydrogenase system regulator [Lachnospiraceae bacterium]MDD3795959.1 iron-only hydrogenase system regulator [Lachnospiraceae bacterium]
METRISVINIIVHDTQKASEVNEILHEYGPYVVGRMGVPYPEKKISIICLILDAPPPVTSALSGKLGMLSGVTAKTVTAKV